jgi:3-oxoacyl-[acyl-carrier protein] reductase
MYSELRGKRVLITGASGDIGGSVARLLAEHGAVLGIHYSENSQAATALVKEIEKDGGQAASFQVNLLSDDIGNLVDEFVDKFGGIDILINNAGGIVGFKDFQELDEASWCETHRLNSQAPFFLAQKAFAFMKEQGGGKIISTSSIAAKYGGSVKSIHYGAAKAALEAMTIGLARFGAPHNILINAIRGGFIDTQFQHRLASGKDLKARIDLIPLKRAGKPDDIAHAVLYLASDAGNFITGEILTVAGGD